MPVQQPQHSLIDQPLIDLKVPVGEGKGSYGNGPSLQPREVKLERPSVFSGKNAELDNFVFEMMQYIDSVGLGDGPRACRFFVSYLKGDAATWWRSYALSHPNVFDNLDLDTLVNELALQFSDVDKLMHVRDKLFKLRQFGSVAQYTATFRRLQIELGRERVNDETAKYMFV